MRATLCQPLHTFFRMLQKIKPRMRSKADLERVQSETDSMGMRILTAAIVESGLLKTDVVFYVILQH